MPDCCPKGSWDEVRPSDTYTPKGETVLLRDGNLSTYYVAPPNSNSTKCVIVFSDVYGTRPRVTAICDELASKGNYHVILPECFRGDTAAGKPDVLQWIATFPYEDIISHDINACVNYLTERAGGSGVASIQIGAVGFCWGAWVIAKASSLGDVPLMCGVGAHPSLLIESRSFGGDEVVMAKGVRMPLLLLTAGNDAENLKGRSDIVVSLESKGGASVDYESMMHGWVTKGDRSVEDVRRCADDALDRTLEFLQRHL